ARGPLAGWTAAGLGGRGGLRAFRDELDFHIGVLGAAGIALPGCRVEGSLVAVIALVLETNAMFALAVDGEGLNRRAAQEHPDLRAAVPGNTERPDRCSGG